MDSQLKIKNSQIQTFFQERSVFLTGATGFLGQMLIEKLIRSTPVKNVYILVRSKNQFDAQKRLEFLLESKLFDTIRNQNENLLKKVIAIHGDITCPGLGMSSLDAALISHQVSVLIHSAATIRFDEPLREAIRVNVGGSKNIYEFSKTIKFLQSVVYISSCMSNCLADKLQEQIYPVNLDPHLAILMAENLSEDQFATLSPSFVLANPNTYVYTKSLAESLGNSYKEVLPIAIVRPSIVTATHKEPFPGWISGLNGATGTLAGVYYGVMRILFFPTKYLDMVPADQVANAVLAAAWRTSFFPRQPVEDVPVYNIISGEENPIYTENFLRFLVAAFKKFPLENRLWKPNYTVLTNSYAKFWLYDFLFHKIPGSLLRTLHLQSTRKLAKFYVSMEKARSSCKFFHQRTFFFSVENKNRLLNSLSGDDREKFDFDITKVSWETYMLDYIKGIRTYIFKEEDSPSRITEKKTGKQIWDIFHENQNTIILTLTLLALTLITMAIFG